MKYKLYIIIAALVFGIGNAFPQSIDENKISKIEEVINKAVELDLFSGCVLIAKGDSILFSGAYGEANKDFHIKNTIETKFNIASGTKPFTSMSIMLLVQKGILSINDPVKKYLPDFPFGDKITLFHCLTHTSGLGHYTDEYYEKMHRVRGFDEFLRQFVYKEKLLFDPGTQFSYSNSGVVVLGAVIEKVSGMKYADFLNESIFTPLGMKNTCSKMPEEIIENRASGYVPKLSGGYLETSLEVCPPTSATGLRTTVGDLYKFIRAVVKNKLLKEEYKKIMLTPYLNDDLGPYALLWDVLDRGIFVKSKNKVFGHRGGQPGFRTLYYNYMDDDITIIVMQNYETNYYIYRPIESIVFGKEYELPKITADMFIYKMLKEKGSDVIIENIEEILEKNNYRILSPNIINNAGYQLIEEEDLGMAINFFRLNVKLFPEDANAYDSLGETYMNAGNKDLAIENYTKSVELDPSNTNAIEKIKSLGGNK